MFKIISKFIVISVGISVLLHLFLSYFGLYSVWIINFNREALLYSITFAIALVGSLTELSKKKILDTIKIALSLLVGLYISFIAIDFVLDKLF